MSQHLCWKVVLVPVKAIGFCSKADRLFDQWILETVVAAEDTIQVEDTGESICSVARDGRYDHGLVDKFGNSFCGDETISVAIDVGRGFIQRSLSSQYSFAQGCEGIPHFSPCRDVWSIWPTTVKT